MCTDKIRTLIIQANPPGTQPLSHDVEQRKLTTALQQGDLRALFAPPVLLTAARIEDLAAALHHYKPHIVHFIGHGDGVGALLLNTSDDQGPIGLSATELADLIQRYQRAASSPLQLILLAGCRTTVAAELLSHQVACVIGMAEDIDDAAVSHVLTPVFYRALGDGSSVGDAFAEAMLALRANYPQAAAQVVAYSQQGTALTNLGPRQWLENTGRLSVVHLEYLTRWFGKAWATLSLADLLPEHHCKRATTMDTRQKVPLLDVYVPLPVEFTLAVKTKAGRIDDWWVKDRLDQTLLEEAMKGNMNYGRFAQNPVADCATRKRHWPELGVTEGELAPLIKRLQAQFDARRAAGEIVRDDRHEQPPFTADAAAALRTHFVLLGNPGSGKSSFLRHLTLCLAGELRQRHGDNAVPPNAHLATLRDTNLAACTPIYMEMHDLVRQVFPPLPPTPENPLLLPTVEDFWRYLRSNLLVGQLAPFETELLTLLRTGKAILLLDGLDEVPHADDRRRRQQIKAWVLTLQQTYPLLRMIVTSRPSAYHAEDWTLVGFGHTYLQPLGLEQLRKLAQALFQVSKLPQAVDAANAFIADVRDHPGIEPSLYANPLFFTLLAALWLSGDRRQLPTTQAELYRRAVDLLLAQWMRQRIDGKSIKDWLGVDVGTLRALLERLACTVHEQSQLEEDTTLFRTGHLLDLLDDAGLALNAQAVADYLEHYVGLLTSPRRGYFYFSHRSLQEHLAACELTCPNPHRFPAIDPDHLFPQGLIKRVQQQPALWENVAWLAADELLRQQRSSDLWAFIDGLCQPYIEEEGRYAVAVPVAMAMARRHDLCAIDRTAHANRSIRYAYDALLQAAQRALTDDRNFLPEERSLAGELLGRRPEHDTRKGVGCRRDGLPDIDWVKIPGTNDQGGQEFLYQEDERRTEATFWMARYPITYCQFQPFLAEDGFYLSQLWEGLAAPKDERAKPGAQAFPFWNHPRENVSWYDAIAFCRWLMRKAQLAPALLPPEVQSCSDWRITLPTEWQWEKAARGWHGRSYPWGESYIPGHANIRETDENSGYHDLQKTSAVGLYPQNRSPFGIVDMSGNVWEYCLNEYSNPQCVQEESHARHVVRGGSWGSHAYFSSLTFRGNSFGQRNFNNGFRVVLVAGVAAAH